jgi:hypothetical protein
MKAAVARYSKPPYNIKYWEIGNEPDVDPTLMNYNMQIFGCWGDKNDTDYYGGDYYAEMLKVVTPAIKAADPEAKVIVGGLLLDCDPTYAYPPPPPPAQPKNCDSGNFLDGILANGGADYFDYVAFHGYAWYWPGNAQNPPQINDETHSDWAHRGGVVVGKIDFLREVMANHNVSKPLILNEAALVCPNDWFSFPECSLPPLNRPPDYFYQDQADYLVKLFVRNIAYDVAATIWFTLEGPGWRHGGLYYDTQTYPTPAYNALDFLSAELYGASYVGTVNQYPASQYPDLWGYEFKTKAKRIWVLGVIGSTGYFITLPPGVQKVYSKSGADVTPVTPPNGQIQIYLKSPIYVEFAP